MSETKRYEKRKRLGRVTAIILVAAMVVMSMSYLFLIIGAKAGASVAVYAADRGSELTDEEITELRSQMKIKMLPSLIEYLQLNYKDELSTEELANGAIEGIMSVLNDPYSHYYYAEETSSEQLFSDLENSYAGIGVSITEQAGEIFLLDVNPTGPAYEAGIRSGGVITAVNGESVSGKSVNEVANMLRGEIGTVVTVSVRMNDKLFAYSVTRRVVRSMTVFGEMLEGNIGYIKVTSMSSDTAQEFLETRLTLLNQGMMGMILDLRNNTGGYIETAISIADQLMDSGVITVYFKQGKPFAIAEAEPDAMRKVPVVMLVNEYTASSAELLAGGLHDTLKVPMVGETTFGKGIAQSTIDLYNDDILRLSVFYFKTPNHHDINGIGIQPDYIVHQNGNYSAEEARKILDSVYTMRHSEEAKAGDISVNILAVQQRLIIMGYNVEANAKLDAKTMAAIKDVQKLDGIEQTGELDRITLLAIKNRFSTWMGDDGADRQLEKAVEVIKELMN